MSVKHDEAANFAYHHGRSHSRQVAAVAADTGVVGKVVLVLDMGCCLVGMGFHFEVVEEVDASIVAAANHMRQAQAIDIPHSAAVAEDNRRVVKRKALVLVGGLVRQQLSATQEACCRLWSLSGVVEDGVPGVCFAGKVMQMTSKIEGSDCVTTDLSSTVVGLVLLLRRLTWT